MSKAILGPEGVESEPEKREDSSGRMKRRRSGRRDCRAEAGDGGGSLGL